MEIFKPGWIFNSVYRVEKNFNYLKNFNPGWSKIASKVKREAPQKQIKSKMASVHKKLKCVILQQFNVISLSSLQMLAVIEWEFYVWWVRIIYYMEFYETSEFLWTCYEIDKLVKRHSKSASLCFKK